MNAAHQHIKAFLISANLIWYQEKDAEKLLFFSHDTDRHLEWCKSHTEQLMCYLWNRVSKLYCLRWSRVVGPMLSECHPWPWILRLESHQENLLILLLQKPGTVYTGLNVRTVFTGHKPSWWKHSSRFSWQWDDNHWSLPWRKVM